MRLDLRNRPPNRSSLRPREKSTSPRLPGYFVCICSGFQAQRRKAIYIGACFFWAGLLRTLAVGQALAGFFWGRKITEGFSACGIAEVGRTSLDVLSMLQSSKAL